MLTFEDFVKIDNNIWYSSLETNGLFCTNIETWETKFIGNIPNEEINECNLYRNIILMNNNLVLVPLRAKEIAVYDLEKCVFEKYKLPYEYENISWKFSTYHIYNNCIYLIPAKIPAIIVFDINSNSINQISFPTYIIKEDAFYSSQAIAVIGNIIYLKSIDFNYIFGFDMDKLEFIEKISANFNYSGLFAHNDILWLISKENNYIGKLKPVANKIITLSNYMIDIKYPLIKVENNIGYIIGIDKCELNVIDLDKDTIINKSAMPFKKCRMMKRLDESHWLFTLSDDNNTKIYISDNNFNNWDKIDIKIPEDWNKIVKEIYISDMIHSNKIVNEKDLFTLNVNLLDFISSLNK